ncbi:UDP-glucose/GDP-mannose dehydrogenase family protein [Carboxydochorda subterranea]|uniref:UDP-glucose 6-dehydrogenase n=1 Tax=Carboxydichorda subterranea TaxID=3109565 RepID=A0ABZ1C1W9_9FIRM|nr:UDP-glucose/GDP-mannose dehydrogenase family protein [Limnochorda sp. L945t]WRP18825.1 UDP-glucose/GDP-mannose dehydrogenase family protein [Limnochorda sp. L945t]
MRVTIIGTGYVGLTTGVALAYVGHEVTAIDKKESVIESLLAGRPPLHEPGLPELFAEVRRRMRFDVALGPETAGADVVLICVGTPPQQNGDADLRYVEEAARALAEQLPEDADTLVVNKSTVPVGSARRVEAIVREGLARRGVRAKVAVASNPEFLREGSALYDTFYPDRIVVGAEDGGAVERLQRLYRPILEQSFPPPKGLARTDGQGLPVFITMTPTSAELCKYAANTFLAMKVSFANEIAGIAERVGADVTEVMRAVGLDRRIGARYLGAGAGWGGSCFGKDVRALLALGEQYGYEMPLAAGTLRVNERQRRVVVDKLQAALKVIRGSTVGLWGLTFKPNTDDLRDAPAVDVAKMLVGMGARVRAYDPVGMERARREHPDLGVEYAASPVEAAEAADAVVLMTEWDEFLHVDWQAVAAVMRGRVVVDGRNALDRAALERLGFRYWGIGR